MRGFSFVEVQSLVVFLCIFFCCFSSLFLGLSLAFPLFLNCSCCPYVPIFLTISFFHFYIFLLILSQTHLLHFIAHFLPSFPPHSPFPSPFPKRCVGSVRKLAAGGGHSAVLTEANSLKELCELTLAEEVLSGALPLQLLLEEKMPQIVDIADRIGSDSLARFCLQFRFFSWSFPLFYVCFTHF